MIDVFISYSSVDRRLAYRIYYDLMISGANVYLYEKTGENGVDFRSEIFAVLDGAKYFCLIDSPNSRKSEWVNKEIRYASDLIQNKRGLLRKIIPCIIDEKGDWFAENEHFNGHLLIRGIDFSGTDRLDYKERYRGSIELLCLTIGIEYTPRSTLPRDRDIEKEVAILDLPDEIKKFLISDYKNFYHSVANNSPTQFSRIESLIADCNILGIELMSCYLAQGSVFADCDDDRRALEVFTNATIKFPDDARSWAAQSGSLFYLSRHEESLHSLNKAISIIEENSENKYLQNNLSNLLINKIQLLIQLGRFKEARDILISSQLKYTTPEYLIAKIKISLLENQVFLGKEWITLKENYYFYALNSRYLNDLIADMEFCIGRHYTSIHNIHKAVIHYNEACKAMPNNIQYQAEFFLLQSCLNKLETEKLKKIEHTLTPKTDTDYYYMGLIHYLSGNSGLALEYYKKSNKSHWRYYSFLVEF